MKTVKITLMAAALTAAGLLAGCSEAPTQAIDEAKTALATLEQSGAAQYAPAELAAANDAMARLQAEMAAQGEKWGMMRRYGQAENLAEAARLAAETAQTATNIAKDNARVAAVARIDEATAELAAVRPLLATAPRGKGSEADLRVLEGDLTAVETALNEALQAIDAGDYIAAEAKAAAALQSVRDVRGAIEAARDLQSRTPGR